MLGVTVECSREPAEGQTDYYIDSIDNECDVIKLRRRAERRLPGIGRIYKITVTATDQGGNQTSAILLILAPRFGFCFRRDDGRSGVSCAGRSCFATKGLRTFEFRSPFSCAAAVPLQIDSLPIF